MKSISTLLIGALFGSIGTYIVLTTDPTICRGVVLQSLAENAKYSKQIASLMPQDNRDFLTVLSEGRK